jgi:hypothetical protein
MFIFSKNHLFVSLVLCIFFFLVFHFVDLTPNFYYFFHLLDLNLACSYFSRGLRCGIKSFIWDLSVFLIYTLMATNFPLEPRFAVSHRFQ